jgi:hypothetical protein
MIGLAWPCCSWRSIQQPADFSVARLAEIFVPLADCGEWVRARDTDHVIGDQCKFLECFR